MSYGYLTGIGGDRVSLNAPFLRSGRDTRGIMLDVCIALTPALTAAVWYFGVSAALLCVLSALICAATEYVFCLLSRVRQSAGDMSAVVTGLILALSLPVTTPVWALLIACFFSIIVAKLLFGGIGQNIMNPAMSGRALLTAFFPAAVSRYVTPYDALSTATPLAGEEVTLSALLSGERAGSMGESSAVLLLLGLGYLFVRGVVRLEAPLGMLGSLALLSFLFGGDAGLFSGSASQAVLSGGALFAACFVVTDYPSTPYAVPRKLLFGVGVGVLTFLLRQLGRYDEGVCFAVIIMNFLTPLIETTGAAARE